jgi:hypothetical protein
MADRGPEELRVSPKIAPVIRNSSASMTMTRAMQTNIPKIVPAL